MLVSDIESVYWLNHKRICIYIKKSNLRIKDEIIQTTKRLLNQFTTKKKLEYGPYNCQIVGLPEVF